MALFQMRWLRRLIRRNTNPIPMDRASVWKNRLSLFYMVVSWNAFGLVCYMVYSGKNDWAKYYGLKTEEDEKLGPGILDELSYNKNIIKLFISLKHITGQNS